MSKKKMLLPTGMLFSILFCLPSFAEGAKKQQVVTGKITVYSSEANAGTGTPSFTFDGSPAKLLFDELTQVIPVENKEVDGTILLVKQGVNITCLKETKPTILPKYKCTTAVFPDGSTGEDEP